MTKGELISLLEPFTDDLELFMCNGPERFPILYGRYAQHNDGEGIVDLYFDESSSSSA